MTPGMSKWSDDKWDRVMRMREEEQNKYIDEAFEGLTPREQRRLVMLPEEAWMPHGSATKKKRKKAYAKYLRKKGRTKPPNR